MQFSPRNSLAPTRAIVASFPFAEVTVTSAGPSARKKSRRPDRLARRPLHCSSDGEFFAQPSSRKKRLSIENCLAIFRLWLGRRKPGGLCNFASAGSCGWRRINPRDAIGRRTLGTGWQGSGAHFTPPRGYASTWTLYLFNKPGICADCSRLHNFPNREGRACEQFCTAPSVS